VVTQSYLACLPHWQAKPFIHRPAENNGLSSTEPHKTLLQSVTTGSITRNIKSLKTRDKIILTFVPNNELQRSLTEAKYDTNVATVLKQVNLYRVTNVA
jgi:hypothetical protein